MRIFLIILFSLFFYSGYSQTPPFVPRSSPALVAEDARLAAKVNFYVPRLSDTTLMGAPDSLGAILYVRNTGRLYIRDTSLIFGGHRWTQIFMSGQISDSTKAAQGLSKKNDTLVWGGYLDSPVVIHALSTKTAYPEPNRLLRMINRGGDTVDYDINPYLPANGFGRPLAHFSRQYYMNDTLPKRYGAAVVGFTRSNLQGATRFKSILTPWDLDYGGFYGANHIFPPDTAYLFLSSFGGVPTAMSGDFAIGGTIPWRVTMIPEHPGYTLPAFKSNIDLARASISVKRETYGAGYSGYLAEFKDYQGNISAGTTNYGSYTPSVVGFHAYGDLYFHNESPSKAKTLLVSTVDTAIGVLVEPLWRDKNEVQTGNAFISKGTQDMSWLAGTFRLGGVWPTVPTGGQLRRFENYGTMRSTDTAIFDNRVLVGKTTSNGSGELQVDSTLRVGDNVNNTWLSVFKTQSITTGNFSTSFRTGIFFRNSFEYPAFVNAGSLETSGLTAAAAHFVGDSIQIGSDITTGTRTQGGVVSILFRRLPGFTDTMLIKGGIDFSTAPTAFHPRLDMSEAGTATSPLFFRGYYTALQPTIQLSEHNYIENIAFLNIGVGQYAGAFSRIDTGYGINIQPFSSKFTVKYAFYQRGAADSLYIAGILKMPNLTVQTDTTLYKPMVVDANGIVRRMDRWPLTALNFWGLTGNAGTNPSTNFIGTTDAQNLVFRTNNTEVGSFSSGGGFNITTGSDQISFIAGGTSVIEANSGELSLGINGSNTVFITSSGVGINQLPQFEALEVNGNIKTNDAFIAEASGVNAEFGTGGGLAFIRTISNHDLQFLTNNIEQMRISASGPVSVVDSLLLNTVPSGIAADSVMVWDAVTKTVRMRNQSLFAGLTGSGVANQVTYWTGTSTVGGDAGWTFNPTTNTITSDSASHIRSIADTVLVRQRIGVASLNPQSRIYAVTDALGGTSTTVAHNSSGLMLANTTAAANGAQQISPTIVLRGNGWGTTAGTSQTVDWRMINSAVQGTVPTGIFRWQVSINGATYTEPMTLTSAGQLTTSSSIVSGGSLGASATANFNWSGRSRLTSPADGSITLANAAGTDFSLLQGGGTTSSFPAFLRSGVNWIVRLADNSANTDLEVLDEAYGVSWNGSNEVPTKNSVYDKIETIGNTLYAGDGTLGGNRIVTGSNNSLTFATVNNFRINSNAIGFSKNDGTIPYTLAVLGAGNQLTLGYTPTFSVYSKGAASIIDTNNNYNIGAASTTQPLYTTGGSLFVNQGLVSNAGNFYKVVSINSNTNANLTQYWFDIDASGGAVTVTLPAASTAFGGATGIQYVFKRIDNSGNSVTIQVNGTPGIDLIDGASNFTIVGQYTVRELQCTSSSTWGIK